MTDFLKYNLELGVCLAAFTLFYHLWLRKEPFFVINRGVLLFAIIFSLLTPVISLSFTGGSTFSAASATILDASVHQVSALKNSIIQLKPVIIGQNTPGQNLNIIQILSLTYFTGLAIHLILFGWRLTRLLLLISKSEKIREDRYCFVVVPESARQSYSFFHFIFMDRKYLDKQEYKPVIDHEKAHAAALHSTDLLITELVIVLQWFNPFVYLLRKAVVENHEFQVDRTVMRSRQDEANYLRSILNQWMNHHHYKLTSAFSQSLLKKRMLMLTKRKTNHLVSKAKLLAVLPLSMLLFVIFACSEKAGDQHMQKEEKKAIAFHQVTRENIGNEIPTPLYQNYHQKLKQKGEQIVFELYSEFEGKEYPQTHVVMKKNNVYGIHLYNCGEGRTTSHIEITDTSGNPLSSEPNPDWVGWQEEKSFYLDLGMMETAPYQITVKDSKDRSNKVVLVMTLASSLDTVAREDTNVYLKPDQMPVYNGHGTLADFRDDVMKNISYPPEAKEKQIDGVVYVKFVVNEAGVIEDKEIMKGAHPLLDQAALEGLEGLPGWHPGMVEGKPVKTQFTIPILFRL